METYPLDQCLYYNLNKTLRTANRRELVSWFPYLKLLMTALWKLSSIRRTVWRGIRDAPIPERGHQSCLISIIKVHQFRPSPYHRLVQFRLLYRMA